MKYILALIIFCVMLIVALVIGGCASCPPAYKITNGEAARRHDLKKFRATYTHKGNFWIVIYRNMNEERKNIVTCKPPFKNGSWVNK